ncbi:MAG: zinc ribbon domain-containing protein [Lachnospiraceae bacterium]|nr:zinc ribbon domain-containing protein [Lachnospiraceae bacterium]
MKKLFSLLLLILLLAACPAVAAFVAEDPDISAFELPAPKAPNYFIFTDGDAKEGHHDDLRMIMVADQVVAALAAEYYGDSDAFYEKYGLYSFTISMQYDVSLDDEEHWQYMSEWDSQYYTDGHVHGYPAVSLGSEMMEDFEFFWLTYYEGPDSDTFAPYKPAILTDKYYYSDGYSENIYSFDVENHSLYIRCRYYMEWETYDKTTNTIGEKQSRFSPWSDSAVFGKNSTQIIPEAPTTYVAPVISDLRILPPDETYTRSRVEYFQTTPESVWMTNIYYLMTDDGYFDGLETQLCIGDGQWLDCDTADSWGDWCLYNGIREVVNLEDLDITEESNIKLRVRFNGSHGPSEWSNVLEINGKLEEGTEAPDESQSLQPTTGDEKTQEPGEKCELCGFCPVPFGLCILIWIAIILIALLLLVIVIAILARRKKKCPACKTKCKRKEKFCPRCGRRF